MSDKRLVQLMISIPRELRNQLRVMAAQENLKTPEKVTSAAEVARGIIINYLKTFQISRRN